MMVVSSFQHINKLDSLYNWILSSNNLPASPISINITTKPVNFSCSHFKYATFAVNTKFPSISIGFFSTSSFSMVRYSSISRVVVQNQEMGDFESDGDKEMQRRKRIGMANKGKVPWNKGRKHSEETRERIRHRTKEALKDPKVRKKMSECPRSLSNLTKARIRASLTKLWDKRLRWKRSREEFMQSWAEAIAKAAKIGYSDQQELDWNSYDKIKLEILALQQQEAVQKAKAKEILRIRAERAAQVKAERTARRAERREREANAMLKGESTTKRRNKRSKEEIKKLAEFQEVKLKERLMKIHSKKSTVNQVSNQHQRSWEKIEVDLVKGNGISLADQIRSAKSRRAAEQLMDNL